MDWTTPASLVLAFACILGAGIGGMALGARIQHAAREQARSQFPSDVVLKVDQLAREQAAFMEAADGVLEAVERKRRQVAARESNEKRQQQQEPEAPPTDEEIRAMISRQLRAQH